MSKKSKWCIYEVKDWGCIPNNEDICKSLNKELPDWLYPEDYEIANEMFGLDDSDTNYDYSYVGDKWAWLFGKVVCDYKPDRTRFGTYDTINKHLAYCEQKNSRNNHYRFFAHKEGDDKKIDYVNNLLRSWLDDTIQSLEQQR